MDYFRSFENFYNRLEAEYKKYGRLIIACDFDNTLYNFHDIDGEFSEVKELIRRWKNHAYIYIFTARSEDTYNFVEKFMEENDVPYENINEGCPDLKGKIDGVKPFYSVLLDDRAGLSDAYKALYVLIRKIEDEEELDKI